MEKLFQKYYHGHYKHTGFIPVIPSTRKIYPGDFFQIRGGELIVLGNIYRNHLLLPEEAQFDLGLKLNEASWNFHEGVSKPYSGRDSRKNEFEEEFEFSKQLLAFKGEGSFMFQSKNPESIRITNWNAIKDELIIKLTQTVFSFREVYVATEAATTENRTLAISESDEGELEIASNEENFGLFDLFGHTSSKTIQSKDIGFYQRETNRKPAFFKAKKLTVKQDKADVFVSNMINQRIAPDTWAADFFEYDFGADQNEYNRVSNLANTSVLDMLPGNQLNPNTALSYFEWTDANLDDVERLFIDYN